MNNKHDRSTGQVSLSDRMRTESVTHKTVLVENDGGDDYDEVRKILDLCQNCWISAEFVGSKPLFLDLCQLSLIFFS